jgi:adenylate cyclase
MIGETRKLAAILAADVVGYSRLASEDEDRILARLRALRSDLIDPFIAGTAQVFGGDPEEALALVERAMALGPLDPSFYMYLMVAGWAHLFSGRPAKTVELAERSVSLYREWDSPYWGLIPAYVQLDRLPAARAALAEFQALAPGIAVSKLQQLLPLRAQASLEMVLDGLRKAGLPE